MTQCPSTNWAFFPGNGLRGCLVWSFSGLIRGLKGFFHLLSTTNPASEWLRNMQEKAFGGSLLRSSWKKYGRSSKSCKDKSCKDNCSKKSYWIRFFLTTKYQSLPQYHSAFFWPPKIVAKKRFLESFNTLTTLALAHAVEPRSQKLPDGRMGGLREVGSLSPWGFWWESCTPGKFAFGIWNWKKNKISALWKGKSAEPNLHDFGFHVNFPESKVSAWCQLMINKIYQRNPENDQRYPNPDRATINTTSTSCRPVLKTPLMKGTQHLLIKCL